MEIQYGPEHSVVRRTTLEFPQNNSPVPSVTSPATVVNSASTTSTLCFTIGLSEINKKIFSILPNPSNGHFNISFEKPIFKGKVEIYNSFGAIIFDKTIYHVNETAIELKNIASGIYFIKIHDGSEFFTGKLIVE